MTMERFEYQHKDLPMLKRDIIFRFIFVFLFSAIFIWQLVLLLTNYVRSTLSPMKTIVAVILLVVSLMFAVISFTYAFKSLNIIQRVILHGTAVRHISIISNAKKDSFLRMYSLAMQLITLAMVVILCCTVTYNILEYVYFTTISFYLPVLLFVCIAGFNSVYHIKDEIKTIQNVREFSSIF